MMKRISSVDTIEPRGPARTGNLFRLSQRTLTLVSLLSFSAACMHASAIAYISVSGGIQKFTQGAASGTQFVSQANANQAEGLALDSAGNLYFATFHAEIIGKVTPGGSLSTYSSSTDPGLENGSEGLTFDSQGNLYTPGNFNNMITRIDTSGVASDFHGPDYGINAPTSLAFDSTGNLFIGDGDPSGGRIEVLSTTQQLTYFATGLTPAGVYGDPGIFGLAIDRSNNIYVSDPITNQILKVTPGGSSSVFATGLGSVRGLAFDAAGNLFAVDNQYMDSPGDNQILEFAAGTNTPTVFATFSGDPGQYLAVAGDATPTPEPATFGLFALAGGCLLAVRRRCARN